MNRVIRGIEIGLALLLCGCTLTIAPIKPQPARHSRHTATAAKPVSSFVRVNKRWVDEYRAMEKSHGDYFIEDDGNIRIMPDGRILVPHRVYHHYQDLSLAQP